MENPRNSAPDHSLRTANAAYDVIVIGGGVIGCAVLRELSRYDLRILLLEKESDLAEGISKANSGVIHGGFNVPPGSLKARTNVAGLRKIYGLASELHVPHRKTGKLVIALTDEERPRLEELKADGDRSGTPDLEIIGEREIRRIEPLARGRWALYSPHTGIISPYEFTIALAECARRNAARVLLEAPVVSVEFRSGLFRLGTPKGAFDARRVVNSAGLFADEVARLAGIADFEIYPYRGEYLVTDKDPGFELRLPLYPVPPRDDPGLGIHITPTMEGNVLLGPSAEHIRDKTDIASTRSVMDRLKDEAGRLLPELRRAPFIHAYSGLRPKLVDPQGREKFRDFVVEESGTRPGWINILGIESPGLTSAPAIAEMVVEMVGVKEALRLKSGFDPGLPASPRFAALADGERAARVAGNPDWGEMVCRCEHVTRAEVTSALRNPFGARTMDAVKRRTRCGMGRCQGGFCTPRIVEIMQDEGIPVEGITKRGGGSRLFYGRIKS
jgi:glycerol-3-phosphate dehydrogenase